jgi:NAD(P)H dehydrogenase (quinone)
LEDCEPRLTLSGSVRILVVFAHPKRDSFTGRVLESFVGGLEEAGHEVEIADLYRESFQPLLVPQDYAQWEDRPMPPEVLREQARVEGCEGIALVFPIWWWSMPAILKGWFDRVFSAGWAYAEDYDPEGSLLPGRKFVVICPAGSSEHHFRKYGYDEMFRVLLEVGTLSYCGVSESDVHIFFEVYWDEKLTESYIPRAREIGFTAFGEAQREAERSAVT